MGNSGNFLKMAGSGFAVFMCICSVITGFVLMSESVFMGFIVLLVGVVNGGIMGALIYAFGEITECVSDIRYRNGEILRAIKQLPGRNDESQKPAEVEHVGLTKQAIIAKSGDGWVCRDCGEKNLGLDLTCRNCGKYK